MKKSEGKITQIIGPVIDIKFNDGELPTLYNAIEIPLEEGRLVVEVAQHLGDDYVRCISMGATE